MVEENYRYTFFFLGTPLWSLSEVKDGLDRTGKKNEWKDAKIACIGMWPRMHFPDLQGLYVFWTTGVMTEMWS